MTLDRLIDPTALLIVIGGTILATLLRCGLGEIRNTCRAICMMVGPRFSETRARASLVAQVQAINRDGLLRAPMASIADKDLAESIGTMLQRRSIDALIDVHHARRVARERVAADAVRLFNTAADLAPVFGLAGTLIALTRLPANGLAPESIAGAVSAAVLTTLYGVLSANLLYGPLARQIARVAEREEATRQAVIDWLHMQLTISPAANSPVPLRTSRARA